ncbi:MAG: CDP-alcohol phosphatidyltransferase family protein [Treponema sp.]|nr:CDP-alcohol phosphatidyltransferase family protein [Treponema sp.]
MLGVYNYTVILTYLGMISSFTGMIFTFNGNLKLALLCLMIAGLLDMFDGKVASFKKNRTDFEKNFGIQIDSFADLISYGVLASLIIFRFCIFRNSEVYETSCFMKYAVSVVCCLYTLCSLIRLSYFNVDEQDRQTKTDEVRSEYKGLPVTSSAVIIPALFIVFTCAKVPEHAMEIAGMALLIVMGLAFITPFKLRKPHTVGKTILITIGISELIFFALMK